MITSWDMHRRACEVLRELEAKMKAGTATDLDRQRYQDGCELTAIWECAYGEDRPAVETLADIPVPGPEMNPHTRRFLAWWERNGRKAASRDAAFVWWVDALRLSAEEELEVLRDIEEALGPPVDLGKVAA